MSTSVTTDFSIPIPQTPAIATPRPAVRRRQISPDAGHALEILGHAIEYLTDEFVHEGGFFSSQDGRLDAVQLLMARNRQIYLSCPQLPSLGERCLAFCRSFRS
jgi:hypothetical protein